MRDDERVDGGVLHPLPDAIEATSGEDKWDQATAHGFRGTAPS